MQLRSVTLFAIMLWLVPHARAELSVLPVFSDHMVLQRERAAAVWGMADAGAKVAVAIAGQVKEAVADAEGKWGVELDPMPAGGPFEMVISDGAGKSIKFVDVMVGDVFLCSGQSNMDWRVKESANSAAEIAGAANKNIRLFAVPYLNKIDEQAGFGGPCKWEVCSPASVENFSAVAYFFGRQVQQEQGVAVGLIKSAVGGTVAEAWTSRQGLEAQPGLKPLVEYLDELKSPEAAAKHQQWEKDLKAWEKESMHADPGNKGEEAGWQKPERKDEYWNKMVMPQHWEKTGLLIDGAVWFRKWVDVPVEWAGKDLTVCIGAVDDFDVTYFNGAKVGAIDPNNGLYIFVERKYTVPGNLVKAGRNLVAVRIFDRGGPGGMFSDADRLYLEPKESKDPKERVPLAGNWQMRVETPLAPYLEPRPDEPMWSGNVNAPTVLYNAMIHPLVGYTLRGALWYQGESNATRAKQYRTLFPAMIADWRRLWGDAEMPFLFVQLSTWMLPVKEPGDSDVAELREAQQFTADTVPHTAMITAVDLGQPDGDIHPRNKQDVAKRLAAAARAVVYKDAAARYVGPRYESATPDGHTLVLRFKNAKGLKTSDGKAPGRFAVAGQDRKWRWAEARIVGETIVLNSPEVSEPAAARYGWETNPVVNVYSGDGLPMLPFRTDDWPMATEGKERP